MKYSATVLGHPVAMAARCAGVQPVVESDAFYSTSISFPAAEWGDRDFDEVFPPEKYRIPEELRKDGEEEIGERPHGWRLLGPESVELKNLPDTDVRSIINMAGHFSNNSAEDRARESVKWLKEHGGYRPRWRDER